MPITFNDPIRPAILAAEELYPDLSLEIVLVQGLVEIGGFAATAYPDGGGSPIIEVDAALPLYALPMTLTHELAHAAVGPEEGHGKAWEAAYLALLRAYCRHVDGGEPDAEAMKEFRQDVRQARKAEKEAANVET